jgi:broad-specificity NMP kinase/DNA-directed RNA polymerase subunit RPC12/RpoP
MVPGLRSSALEEPALFNVCAQCGAYHADKRIEPEGPYAVCPACGHRQRFRRLPLLVIGGASGTGKSAICRELVGQAQEAVVLDADILWRPEFATPEDGYRAFFETWLRLAKNIAQSGRPVVLLGAGMVVPSNLEPCVERRYFARVHYLALVCEPEELEGRLRDRPAWRESGDSAWIEEQVRFDRWLRANAEGDPPITLVDTTSASIQATAERVTAWIRGIVAPDGEL